jgi:glycosyltransferase involved in cell wall biosynthesis
MTRLVSILVPAYNAERWIAETLQSALGQTWPRKEIIVVDDGSTDGTLDVARRFAGRQVSVVTQENQGSAATRNKAFSLCQGEYVQWLDADDLLTSDKIASQMEVRERGCTARTLLSSGWGYFMYRPSRARFTPTALWRDLSPTEWLLRKMSGNLHMQTATWLVSRELTEAAGPWDPRLLVDDDGEYFCRVLLQSDGVRFVREGGVYYRMIGSNRVSYIGRSSGKMEAQLRSMRLHIRYLLSLEDSDRSRAACLTYLQTWVMGFYPDRPDLVKEAEALAADLGGRLDVPTLSWKYDWVRRLFGWSAAQTARFTVRELKWSLLREWDRTLRRFEGQAAAAGSRVGGKAEHGQG